MKLNKYRLSLPLSGNAVHVAAKSPLAAAKLLLPDDELSLQREGRTWARYVVGRDLEPTWPSPNEHDIPGTGGRIVDVEHHGEILVCLDEGDE